MNLEDDIAQSLAEEMAKELDKDLLDDLMTDVLLNDGWTGTGSVNPAYGTGSIVNEIDWYARTAEWIDLNAQGDYKLLKGQWLFSDPKDATMFILRWS
jgi:hypothetical protein